MPHPRPQAREISDGPDAADLAVPTAQPAALPPKGANRTRDPMSRDAEPDLEALLHELQRRGWTLICCGRQAQPDALAAVHRNPTCCADVVVLRGHDRAAAYRTLTRPNDDPLQATRVVWHYLGDAECTLRAVLNIPPNSAPSVPYPIPRDCRIPEAQRRPVLIRPGHQPNS